MFIQRLNCRPICSQEHPTQVSIPQNKLDKKLGYLVLANSHRQVPSTGEKLVNPAPANAAFFCVQLHRKLSPHSKKSMPAAITDF